MKSFTAIALVAGLLTRAGVAQESAPDVALADTAADIVDTATEVGLPFPRVMVARPNVPEYDGARADLQWAAAVIEAGLLTSLTVNPAVHCIPPEVFGHELSGYRDFGWRVEPRKYQERAGRYGATHLVYSELASGDSRDFVLHLRIIDTESGTDAARAHVAVDLDDPAGIVDACLKNLYGVLPAAAKESAPGPALPLGERELVQSLGEEIVGAGAETDSAVLDSRASQVREVLATDAGAFAAAMLFRRAGAHRRAAETLSALEGGGRVIAARYYRYAGEFDAARGMLERADAAALAWETQLESYLIDAWGGYLDQSASLCGGARACTNGEVLLSRALAAVHDTSGTVGYDRYAEAYGAAIGAGATDAMLEIGKRCRAYGSPRAAHRAFGKAVGLSPEDNRAWRAYAQSHLALGDREGAVRIYLNAVELDPLPREALLLAAGRLLDEDGRLERAARAIDEYSAAGGTHPDIVAWQTRLAAADGDCKLVLDRSASMDKAWRRRPDVASALRTCGAQAPAEVPIPLVLDTKPRLRKGIRLAVGITGGAVAAGGLVAGLLANGDIESLAGSYNQSRDKQEVETLHSQLKDRLRTRAVAYATAGAGALTLALNFTIPAIRQ